MRGAGVQCWLQLSADVLGGPMRRSELSRIRRPVSAFVAREGRSSYAASSDSGTAGPPILGHTTGGSRDARRPTLGEYEPMMSAERRDRRAAAATARYAGRPAGCSIAT
eukprot:scaffold8656_cov69-Phaeocystis_antarctica.AAC.7